MEHRRPVSDSQRPRGRSTPASTRPRSPSRPPPSPRCAWESRTSGRQPVRRPGRPRYRSGNSSGRPNVSFSPCTTSVVTPAPTSSSSRDFSGRPGGCSGKASARQPAAPSAVAVRAADRAPADRPPTTSGVPDAQRASRRREADVERGRRAGHLAALHPPRLLEQQHADALPRQGGRQRLQVAGVDALAGAVAEQQRRDRPARPVGDQSAVAVRRTDALLGGHARSVSGQVGNVVQRQRLHQPGPLLRTLLTALDTG